jgi:hypothetical protein
MSGNIRREGEDFFFEERKTTSCLEVVRCETHTAANVQKNL